jgi:TolB-like protein/Flp pilus assembly protein TadD
MVQQKAGSWRFFAELRRRRVPRVIAMYGAVAFGVIEAADLVFPRLALPDWSVTLVVALALLGLPVAAALAWAFELTPEGMRLTAEATPDELTDMLAAPAHHQWGAVLLGLAGFVVLLAGAWFVGRQTAPGAGRADTGPAPASIAVLPFVNMSSDPEQEYFSDGLSEELLNLLSRIPELRVAARTSSFAFKGGSLEIPEIAARLGVAHVLEGSVRKSGNEVRITAQLIEGEDGYHVWSRSWDRTLEDVFAVQDEIAADVADQLEVTLLGRAPAVRVTDPAAWELFLEARELSHEGAREALERSNRLLRRAIEIDSAYAPAWSQLAYNYTMQAGVGLRLPAEGVALARAAVERALAADPDYAPAHATLARIADNFDGDLATAARHLQRALELAPNDPMILMGASILASDLGRPDPAITLLEHAAVLDPVNPRVQANLGLAYRSAGRPDEAIARLQTAIQLSPEAFVQRFLLGLALLDANRPGAALEAVEAEPEEGWRLLGIAIATHALGRAEESDSAIAALVERHARTAAYNIAYTFALRGEPDRAFEWLDRAVEYGDPGLAEIQADADLFANLADDPRWLPFLERIGRSPAQLAAIEFDIGLPD